ncbi:tRNA 4-thiouridine(8) synthase ThiI [Candidatus Peregrinibacteria bacterium]|jgi:tRNA uracil 4-sulfurtransferase|nr:tRNA 4-thiouridine(8) synthase ThiI [Candidatus Peregrinibacteria bacterium]MBT7703050.1 tRNA 4-thiouridine(8) synthase ThiI [Candidatus Peregrinibacteria bacterium]
MATAIIHYHEIALKGGNRSFFEAKLKENLARVMVGFEGAKVEKKHDHFRVHFEKSDEDSVREILGEVCGVENFSFVSSVARDFEEVIARGLEMVQAEVGESEEVTFRVAVHRSDKNFEMNSMEIAKKISAGILPVIGSLKVNLKKAEVVLYVDWGAKEVQLSVKKEPGLGGLPVGVSGKVVSLISSGFDSPVASFMMMRRGATVIYVHFHSYPATGMESMENVKKIVEKLNRFQGKSKLYMIPLIDFQKEVVKGADAALRVLLYRRMMIRLAERVMRREKAKALVTGESLAQVASQTLENMNVVNVLASRPVLRPLIGMNKNEIIKMAEQIGTAEISMQPYDDCCSLYIPKAPALSARVEELEEAEKNLDIEKFEQELWEARELIKVG